MQVALCQIDTVWENKAANHAKVQRFLKNTPLMPGALVVLPEMFATGFSMNVPAISDSETHETELFLAEMAQLYGITLLGGVVTTAPDGKGQNEAVAYGPDGKEIARYCKMHPFSYGGETAYYRSGEHPILFSCQDVEVAPFVCYDLRFPEIFRSAVRQGAELFVVIANWPGARAAHWQTLLQARAIENQAFVVGVNRCGSDPQLTYTGGSLIIDPRGKTLFTAYDKEFLVEFTLLLEELRAYREEFPALRDIHPAYVPIEV